MVVLSKPSRASKLPQEFQDEDRITMPNADWDDALDPCHPTLTLPIGQADGHEDSFDVEPPRLSTPAEEIEHTLQSLELARRGSERLRISQGSFGNRQLSNEPGDMSNGREDTDLTLQTLAQDIDELSGPLIVDNYGLLYAHADNPILG